MSKYIKEHDTKGQMLRAARRMLKNEEIARVQRALLDAERQFFKEASSWFEKLTADSTSNHTYHQDSSILRLMLSKHITGLRVLLQDEVKTTQRLFVWLKNVIPSDLRHVYVVEEIERSDSTVYRFGIQKSGQECGDAGEIEASFVPILILSDTTQKRHLQGRARKTAF